MENQETITEIKYEVGRVLHMYSSTFMFINQSIDEWKELLEIAPNEFCKSLNIEEELNFLKPNLVLIENCLYTTISYLKYDTQHLFNDLLIEKFTDALKIIKNISNIEIIEFRRGLLTEIAKNIINEIDGIKTTFENNDLIELYQAAKELRRLLCLILILQIKDTILEMDYQTKVLRDFLTWGERINVQKKVISVYKIISNAVKNVELYAVTKNVEIRINHDNLDDNILGNERDITRAVSNIMNNAIKYTWSSTLENREFIKVFVVKQDNYLKIIIRNIGVPITRDEIEQEFIFQIGYRGIYSGDRGRLGTGIGLGDAKRVITNHGGHINIESKPVNNLDFNNYNQPFLTTVEICLPIRKIKK
jgi:signal transduction histidine kinase